MADQSSAPWLVPMSCGLHDTSRDRHVSDYLLNQAVQSRIDILTTPITNSHFRERVFKLAHAAASVQDPKVLASNPTCNVAVPPIPPLNEHDTTLVPSNIVSQLVGVTSDWIDLCSPDPLIAQISRQVLTLEVQYASFCGIDHILIHGPRLYYGDAAAADISKYARYVQEAMDLAMHASFYIKTPMFDYPDAVDFLPDGLGTREEFLDAVDALKPADPDMFARWDSWNLIRSLCKYSSRLLLALCVPMHIPDASLQARWFSEPVRMVIFEKTSFMEDGRGTLGLPRSSREFLSRILRLKNTPWILLWGTNDLGTLFGEKRSEAAPRPADVENPTPAESAKVPNSQTKIDIPFIYRALAFFSDLQQRQPITSDVERYGTGYQDYLQIPLQPLADNLESMTYEVFEKDPVKYNLYEEAIRGALRDWKKYGTATSGPDGKVVVTVAGAGRGPLVTRALQASQTEGVPIDLWAVEKNPNAFVLLQKHNRNPEKWNGAVHLVQSDMRSWAGPIDHVSNRAMKIDILVTELLGSFADNELSPECLDGILHRLAPTGISIPQSYTPYLTPVSAPKIYADISSRTSWEPTAPETPAVVWLHSIDYLSCIKEKAAANEFKSPSASVSLPAIANEPVVLPAWDFVHGPQDEHRGICHGLGGYFQSVLYPGVILSTNPVTIESYSKDMISWFPIFFPLKTPMLLPDNASITCSIWRQTDGRKVWYEWMLESWIVGPSHQKIRIGQSELHSSVKNGCLM